ncbi:MAG: lipid-A-disaccharide synthase [Hyphomicrobiales bacterium]|nr:MAG: lipid-A-disaccharide synthase [Hyphomicrobiales bacterium]
MSGNAQKPLRIAIVAGEHSGDQLGAELIRALKHKTDKSIELIGVGGHLMEAEGLKSLFPLADIAVMGFSAVVARLPKIIRLAYKLIDHIVRAKPDILIIIDSPDFTHPVAKRVRRKLPDLPIIDYVSPSVWAWRSGRAKKMNAYVDHVLAILPFEPDAYIRLAGPKCTYVGHPLVNKIERAKQALVATDGGGGKPLHLLVMPGSRNSEVSRLLEPFGQTVAQLKQSIPDLKVDIPAVPHLLERLKSETADWAVKTNIVVGEAEKFATFERADAALVASGTATLELALWGVPMAVGYKLDPIARRLKWLGEVDSIVLPNLVLGKNVVPEFIDEDCTAEQLTNAVLPLLQAGSEKTVQLDGFAALQTLCSVAPKQPAELAAELVCEHLPK